MDRESYSEALRVIPPSVMAKIEAAGLAVVPRDPIPEMVEAAGAEANAENAAGVWRDMIESALENGKLF